MDRNDIITLVRFNFWANDRLLAACQRLSLDDFTRPAAPDPGWGSLRGLLVHVLDTEFGWRSILQGQDASTILDASDFEDVAALKARWDTEKAAWFAYASEISNERLGQGYGGDEQNGPKVWQTILHVVSHGIHHRGETALILTGYGCSPGELDFGNYLQEVPD